MSDPWTYISLQTVCAEKFSGFFIHPSISLHLRWRAEATCRRNRLHQIDKYVDAKNIVSTYRHIGPQQKKKWRQRVVLDSTEPQTNHKRSSKVWKYFKFHGTDFVMCSLGKLM